MQKRGSVDVDHGYLEITLDVLEDSMAVHTVKTTVGANVEDPGLTMKGLGKRSSTEVKNASARIRQVTQELNRFTLYSGRPPATRYDETKSDTTCALNGLNFISKTDGAAGWAALEKRFDDITRNLDPIGLLPRSRFGECLGTCLSIYCVFNCMDKDSNEFVGELLVALMRRRHMININLINKAQLKEFWEQIGDQSFDSRLQTFFDMVNKDANGRISEDEVREIIRSSASANRLCNIQEQADEYATLIMEKLDPDNHGYIMIESLEALFLQPSTQSERSESKNLSVMLSQKLRNVNDTNTIQQIYNGLKYFLQDNWQRVWVISLWITVMAVLFTWKYIQYKNRAAFEVMGHCISVAKGAAETLKLNMALILLPVCRNTITWLRNKTKLGAVVPFDDNLNFHKVITFGITIGVGLHTISHLACDFPRLLTATEEEYKPMELYFGKQPDSYWWFVKGVEGWTGILMIVLMTIAFTSAMSWFRRERINLPKSLNKLTGFNSFWYSHHLFIIVYAMLILHGIKLYLTKEWYKKTTWMYLAVPILLYAGERLTRALRSSVNPVKILKVAVYPGNVLALHMSKPEGFKYKSGQYMFVKCSAVSPFEWHPFSITSAPGDDYLGLHIQALGDWTTQVRTLFSQVCQPSANGKQGGNILPKVLIDGPYSAPLQDYNKYDVVLLVGLGIRAAPIFSIIKDILNNIKAKQEEEYFVETCGDSTMFPTSPLSKKSTFNDFKTTRAYCYWVTREQGTFNWFKVVMNEVAETAHDGVIEMHNYCTSVYEKDDARSTMIAILQSLNYSRNGVDVVSGTRVESHFAKPDWRSVYKRIALLHPRQRIGVFYGGIPELVEELKQLAFEFSHKSSTKFEFHVEIF